MQFLILSLTLLDDFSDSAVPLDKHASMLIPNILKPFGQGDGIADHLGWGPPSFLGQILDCPVGRLR